MILFLRFRRATLLLTRGMDRSLHHQQPLEAGFVGLGHHRGLGFLFGHLVLPGLVARGISCHFGASTIDMLRPSSFGSCSILAMSFSSLATRSSTARPRSMWAICRPRYIIVTFTLLPSCRNSRACRVLNAKS